MRPPLDMHATFQSMGEIAVRMQLEHGGFNYEWKTAAIKWLAAIEAKNVEAANALAEAQRKEDVARWNETRRSARSANVAAWVAAISAILLGIAGIVATILF